VTSARHGSALTHRPIPEKNHRHVGTIEPPYLMGHVGPAQQAAEGPAPYLDYIEVTRASKPTTTRSPTPASAPRCRG
jgi:hypothetical protein